MMSGADITSLAAKNLPPDYLGALQRELDSGADPAIAPGAVYERTLSRARRRGTGTFYTPGPIAEMTVQRTLAPLIKGRDVEQILSLRIADLACGGGIFAGYALRFLEQHCIAHDSGTIEVLGSQAALRRHLVEKCISAVDVDPGAAAVCRIALRLFIGDDPAATAVASRAVHVADALLDALPPAGYDAIVGTPPWGQKQFQVSKQQRQALRERYRTARGPLDPFKLFVERAHELLRVGGRWGMVLPDIILLKDQESIRRLILEQSEIDLIAHLGRAFEGVNIDAITLVGQRADSPRPDHRVELREGTDGDPRWQRQSLFGELPRAKFNIYLDDHSLPLYQRLRKNPKLGDRFEIHEGVHSGNSRAKLFLDHKPAGKSARLILGRNELRPFQLNWSGRWIDLEPSSIDRTAGDYANLGQARWHLSHKLVVRRTGDRIVAARDLDGHFVSNNLFVLVPRDQAAEEDLSAYLALLGSSLYTWYFRTDQPRVGRLFAELKIRQLRDFPVPEPARWTQARNNLAEAAQRLEQADTPAARTALDGYVAELFELDERERSLVSQLPQAASSR